MDRAQVKARRRRESKLFNVVGLMVDVFQMLMSRGEATKKVIFSSRATKRGRGKSLVTNKKELFLKLLAKSFVAIFGNKNGSFSPKIL